MYILLITTQFLFFLLQFPFIQNVLTGQAETFLNAKLKTRVEIGEINFALPHYLVVKDVLILDYQQDTLWASQELRADLFFEELLKSNVVIDNLILQKATAKIYQQEDGYFNYEPLLAALTDTTSTSTIEEKPNKPWGFAIKKVILGDVNFEYKSSENKLDLKASLGGMRANVSQMDLKKQHLHLDYFDLKNANIQFLQGNLEEAGTDTLQESKRTPPDILFKEISLNNVKAIYSDSISEQKVTAHVGTARIVARKTSLITKEIIINKALLYDSEVAYETWAVQDTITTGKKTTTKAVLAKNNIPWFFRLYELEMAGNRFAYNKTKAEKLLRGLDYNHILVYDQSAFAENIIFGDTILKANINQLSFTEKSGFQVKRFNTNLSADNQKLVMRNFLMETENSLLNEYIALDYNGLQNIADTLENLSVNISLNRAKIGLADILYFQPELYSIASEKSLRRASASVDLRLKGSLKELELQKCRISLLSNSFANFRGRASNLLGEINADLEIDTLNLASRDIRQVAQGTSILDAYQLPENTGLSGFFKGTFSLFRADLKIHSTLGSATLGIVQKVDSTQTEPSFNAVAKVTGLQVGTALKMPETIGEITTNLVVSGKGLKEGNPSGNIRGSIEKITLLGYPYQNGNIDGEYSLEGFNGELTLDDPNVQFQYSGEVKYKEEVFSSDFRLAIEKVDLSALGFLEESRPNLIVSTQLTSRLRRNAKGYFNGEVFLNDLQLTQEEQKYLLKNLEAFVTENDNRLDVSVRSDWLDLNAKSNAPFFLLLNEIPTIFYDYYAYSSEEPVTDSIPRKLEMDGKLKKTAFITEMLYSDLQKLSPGDFMFSFDQKRKTVEATLNFSEARYADTDFRGFQLKANGSSEQLDYRVALSEAETETFRIINPSISGMVKDNVFATKLNLNDSLEVEQFVIGGILTGRDSSFKFQLNPDELKLNYDPWIIPAKNFISYQNNVLRSEGLFFQKADGEESLGIEFTGSDSTQTNLLATFQNFEMSFLTKAVQSEENLIGGQINGAVAIRNITDTLKVNADFTVHNFELMGDTLGNISLQADNEEDVETYVVSTALTERGNDVKVSGTYQVVSTKNPVNFVIEINRFNVETIQNLAFGQVSQLSGTLEDSRIVFRGNADQPIVRGSIYIPSLGFKSNYLNASFSLANERIRFTPRGIHLEKFSLKDGQKREAVVDGDIFTTNYVDYRFDLNVSTNNFLVLNTNANDNDLFYGRVLTSSKLKITGTPALPKIDMDATILKGTKLTYILPDENLETVNRAGIVEFVDIDSDSTMVILENEGKGNSQIEGFDFEANIIVDNEVELTIVIDPEAGDQLTVKGGGNLSFTINPAGTMTLAGIYAITEGDYLLTFYDLVKRRFKIKPGSQLIWTGDPYDAELEITALYETKAIPYELFPPTENPDEVRARQQQLPFIVGLTMRGALDAPEVLFSIGLPELNKGALNGTVNAQLQRLNQDEADLNKQVFALLILNSFISTNPFEGTGQNNLVSSTARTSVSRLLTQQLNRLSSRFIKGLDLNFELSSYDDYASGSVGGRTELGVELSKELFNERISINVGGNVNLTGDGSDQQNQQNAQQIAGNVSLEYRLSRDGRYRLRVYRRNAFEGLIDGDFIETGVSFIFTKDYNSLRDLFKGTKPKKNADQKDPKAPAKNGETPKIEEEKQ